MCIVNFLDEHNWIASFLGILLSAGVAIYVMNSNQKQTLKLEKERRYTADESKMRVIDNKLLDILNVSGSLYEVFRGHSNVYLTANDSKIVAGHLDQFKSIIDDINDYELNSNEYRYLEPKEVARIVNNDIRSIQAALITGGLKCETKKVNISLYSIHNVIYDYLEKSDYVTLKNRAS